MIERCAGGVKLYPNKRCSVCDAGPGDQCARAALRDWEEREAMRKALEHVRGIIAEAALTGFNYKDGDWADRLFASQQVTSAALSFASAYRKGE